MAIVPPDEEERLALVDWLTANGVNIRTVPRYEHGLRIEERDGQRSIHYTEYVLTEDGRKQVDPEDHEKVWLRPASTPCLADPPAWLNIPGGEA